MKPYTLYTGDNVRIMQAHIADNSQDSCVTDGPYGIRFMGKAWDSFDIEKKYSQMGFKKKREGQNHRSMAAGKYNTSRAANYAFQEWFRERAVEVYRVLKPGGYFVSFGSPRTFHRMVCGVEDAGFEIRDTMMWIFASGFPKNKDLTDYGYDGWGTGLKPGYEPILIARKPISESNIQTNMKVHGVGGINIDACRIPYTSDADFESVKFGSQPKINGGNYIPGATDREVHAENIEGNPKGRWPANVMHDGSDEVVKLFPFSRGQKDAVKGDEPSANTNNVYNNFNGRPATQPRGDSGTAARFFYCPKIAPEDRSEGLPDGVFNTHPTVKPTDIMRYLVKLVTPVGGKVLDIFGGSGSTGKAAIYELCEVTLIDEDPQWIPIQEARCRFAMKNRSGQFSLL